MLAKRRQRLDTIGFVWDPLESAWEEGFAALTAFKAREGHCLVPRGCVEGGFSFEQWMSVQRRNKYSMPPERRRRLDAIGFIWDPLESAWEEGFAALTAFKARDGHCRVPALHIEGTFALGSWVRSQRRTTESLPTERKRRLEAVGFVWDPFEVAWKDHFAALTAFKGREGHCRVPPAHIEGTLNLGQWVGTQRRDRDKMPADRKHRLDTIGFVWDPLESAWEEGFAALTAFNSREGHCLVPVSHVEGALKLGQWVRERRKSIDAMPADRKHRLDTIGFVWDPLESAWKEGFAALTAFKAREGHCRVPALHLERKFKLGQWVRLQRQSKDTMPAERTQRLDEIAFVWRAK